MPLIVVRPSVGEVCLPNEDAAFCQTIENELDDFCDVCRSALPAKSSVITTVLTSEFNILEWRSDSQMIIGFPCGIRISCSVRDSGRAIKVDSMRRWIG